MGRRRTDLKTRVEFRSVGFVLSHRIGSLDKEDPVFGPHRARRVTRKGVGTGVLEST